MRGHLDAELLRMDVLGRGLPSPRPPSRWLPAPTPPPSGSDRRATVSARPRSPVASTSSRSNVALATVADRARDQFHRIGQRAWSARTEPADAVAVFEFVGKVHRLDQVWSCGRRQDNEQRRSRPSRNPTRTDTPCRREERSPGPVQSAFASRRSDVPSMPLPLFSLTPAAQRGWIEDRLARPVPRTATGMSDGFRLPGREGPPTPAAVLVPGREQARRPHDAAHAAQRGPSRSPRPDQLSRRSSRTGRRDARPRGAARGDRGNRPAGRARRHPG